jgi:hypothetical protein
MNITYEFVCGFGGLQSKTIYSLWPREHTGVTS